MVAYAASDQNDIPMVDLNKPEERLPLYLNRRFSYISEDMVSMAFDSFRALDQDKLKNSIFNGIAAFKHIAKDPSLQAYYAVYVFAATAMKALISLPYLYYHYNGEDVYTYIKSHMSAAVSTWFTESFVYEAIKIAAEAFAICLMIVGGPHSIGLIVIATVFYGLMLAMADTYKQYLKNNESGDVSAYTLCSLFLRKFVSYSGSYLCSFISFAIPGTPILAKLTVSFVKANCDLLATYIDVWVPKYIVNPIVKCAKYLLNPKKSAWMFGSRALYLKKNKQALAESKNKAYEALNLINKKLIPYYQDKLDNHKKNEKKIFELPKKAALRRTNSAPAVVPRTPSKETDPLKMNPHSLSTEIYREITRRENKKLNNWVQQLDEIIQDQEKCAEELGKSLQNSVSIDNPDTSANSIPARKVSPPIPTPKRPVVKQPESSSLPALGKENTPPCPQQSAKPASCGHSFALFQTGENLLLTDQTNPTVLTPIKGFRKTFRAG